MAHEYALLAGIVTLAFAVYALSPVTTSTDSAWTFHLATSILREHNIDLDEYKGIIDLQLDYRMRVINGHIYSYYPIATPLLVAPAVWAINLLYPVSHTTDFYTYLVQHAPDDRTARLEKLVASGIVALATGIMYLVARRQLARAGALAAALMFGFATSMWSTASRALWQHGPSVLLLILALYLTIMADKHISALFWVGCTLGYAYLVRPTNSLSVAFFGIFFLVNQRERFWQYFIGVAIILGPYVAYNLLTYQRTFPPYSYQLFERLATPAAAGEAMLGTLVSPSRGLFIFTPIFLFSVHGAYLAARRGALSLHRIEAYLIAILVSHWITTSMFEDWGGAWSIGPRYFVDMIPFFLYLLLPSIDAWPRTAPILKYGLVTAVLFSTWVQFRCATSIYPFMWNGKPKALVEAPERKWDWGDLQFLRGLCREDPLEGRAPACWLDDGG